MLSSESRCEKKKKFKITRHVCVFGTVKLNSEGDYFISVGTTAELLLGVLSLRRQARRQAVQPNKQWREQVPLSALRAPAVLTVPFSLWDSC